MIKPMQSDIGRRVVYRSYPKAAPCEGTIISIEDQFVFVRYRDGGGTHAINRHNLEWTTERIEGLAVSDS